MNQMKRKVMVNKIGQVTVKPSSKKDQCGICGIKTMLNAVLCKSCGKLIHGRCAKIERVTNRLAIYIKCRKCKGYHKKVENLKEKLLEDVETVTKLSYLDNRINSRGGCEADVTSRTSIGWAKFRECHDLLCRKKLPLKIIGIVYKSCVRSAMLYGSETWCLGQNERGIL